MRFLLAILITLLLVTPVLGKDSVVPKRYLSDVKAKLEKLEAIENAIPYVTIKHIEVVQDADNRVFVKDTASVVIKLAMLEYEDSVPIKASVKGYYNKKSGHFVSRFGLATVAEQQDYMSSKIDKNSVYLTFNLVGFKRYGLESMINFRRYGFAISRSITPNTKLLIGVNYRFRESMTGNSKLFIGAGFRF